MLNFLNMPLCRVITLACLLVIVLLLPSLALPADETTPSIKIGGDRLELVILGFLVALFASIISSLLSGYAPKIINILSIIASLLFEKILNFNLRKNVRCRDINNHEAIRSDTKVLGVLKGTVPPVAQAVYHESFILESITLNNYKNFDEFHLDLTAESILPGQWTCIAGINGVGKSSILLKCCSKM